MMLEYFQPRWRFHSMAADELRLEEHLTSRALERILKDCKLQAYLWRPLYA
jgi:hypothetical protein